MISFTKRLHEGIVSGEITCSVRIWQRPRVKRDGRYAFGSGHIQVTGIRQIEMSDITPELARRSGFAGVVDLLKVAKHGKGENIYLVDFVYVDKPKPPERSKPLKRRARRP
ncbi:MAG: ASCH domain-containing protein [Alphaproteobacteria bacterium]|nr:ASCH domain-containing protein [Alphaproteobacteria bacterium]